MALAAAAARKWINEHVGEDLLQPVHEAFARRNVYVHSGGTATANYVAQYPESGVQVGYPLPLTREYLLEVADTASSVARTTTGRLLDLVSENRASKARRQSGLPDSSDGN